MSDCGHPEPQMHWDDETRTVVQEYAKRVAKAINQEFGPDDGRKGSLIMEAELDCLVTGFVYAKGKTKEQIKQMIDEIFCSFEGGSTIYTVDNKGTMDLYSYDITKGALDGKG